MITWLSRELVIAIHDRQLAEHAGSAGLRDNNLLESALARPQQLLSYSNPTADICQLAASLAYGVARNHPFIDGSKRTAWVCCRTFLALNDYEMHADQLAKYKNILGLAEGLITEAEFADWLREHTTINQTATEINEPSQLYGDKS